MILFNLNVFETSLILKLMNRNYNIYLKLRDEIKEGNDRVLADLYVDFMIAIENCFLNPITNLTESTYKEYFELEENAKSALSALNDYLKSQNLPVFEESKIEILVVDIIYEIFKQREL